MVISLVTLVTVAILVIDNSTAAIIGHYRMADRRFRNRLEPFASGQGALSAILQGWGLFWR